MKYQCPVCKEEENLHFNLDFSKRGLPVLGILCNQCGLLFIPNEKPNEEPIADEFKDL